jgi:hypothetical protein
MFGTVLVILIAGAVAILAAMRFIAAVRKLTSREPDTRGHKTSNRQDKPPLVFWAVASPLLAAACVTVILLML